MGPWTSPIGRRKARHYGATMAVGLDVRVGRFGWVTDIQWIAVCYQGKFQFLVILNFI